MTNNYSAMALEQAPKKFLMCSIAGRRWAQPFLSDLGGNLFSMSFSGPNFISISDDSVWARVNYPPANEHEYSFEDDTLTFYSAAQLDDLQYKTIVNFNWTFSSDLERYQNNNFDTSLNEVVWQSRLGNKPKFKFSQENNLYGILSVDEISLSIANMDRALSKWFTRYDSYKNSEVQVWQCFNNEKNFKSVFTGTVRAAVRAETCTFAVASVIKNLDKTVPAGRLGFGFDPGTTYILGTFVDRDKDKVVRRIYGNYSPFGWKRDRGTSLGPSQLDSSTMLTAICTSFNFLPSKTNNRQWIACLGDASTNEFSGTIATKTAAVIAGAMNGFIFTITGGIDPKYLSPGDQIEIHNGGTRRYVGTVHNSDGVNIYCYPNTELSPIVAGDTICTSPIKGVILEKDGVEYQLRYRRDYTCSSAFLQQINLVNNFEDNFGLAEIDPQNDTLYFKYGDQNSANFRHGTLLKTLLEDVFDVSELNAASFTAADTDFPYDACLCYPAPGVESLSSYRGLIEQILKSTLGTLYFDNDGLLGYKVLDVPAPTDNNIEDADFNGQISTDVNYNDCYNRIIFRHPSFPFNKGPGQFEASFPLNLALHLSEETLFQEFYLDMISVDSNFKDAIFKLARILTDPKKIYTLTSIIKNYESLIADEYFLTSGDVGEQESALIIGIAKGEDQTDLVMTDYAKNRSVLQYVNDGLEYDENNNPI